MGYWLREAGQAARERVPGDDHDEDHERCAQPLRAGAPGQTAADEDPITAATANVPASAQFSAGHAMAAARDLSGAARHAASAAGQAAAVVAAHELGAAAYAIKAACAAAPEGEGQSAGRVECRWQREQLPEAIRELVLDDQRLRNDICWSVFDC